MRFPIDGTGRLSSEREHPTAALTGPAGGDLAGSFPNPTVGSRVAVVSSPSSNGVPVLYMPVPSGGDDTSALQAVLTALPATGGCVVFQHGSTYQLNGSLLLPQHGTGSRPTFIVEGNGAILQSPSGSVATSAMLTHTFPTDQTDASVMTGRKFVIRNLVLDNAPASAYRPGLRIAATEDTHIEDVTAIVCSTGIELTFCLGAQVNNCEAINCATYGFVAQSGKIGPLWTGATEANSPCNVSKFQSCRNYALTGMTAGFGIFASGGVELDGCTTEGGNPVDNVLFDYQVNTSVEQFTIRHHHFENAPSGANIRVTTASAVNVEHPTYSAGVFFDGTGSVEAAQFVIEMPGFFPTNPTFTDDGAGAGWFFPSAPQAFDPTASAHWTGGVVPSRVFGIVLTGGGTGFRPQIVATPSLILPKLRGDNLNILGLPSSDPGVAGQLYTAGAPSAGVPKALMVSGG